MRFIILLALFGAALAAPKSVQRIVGGVPTTVDNYPFIANMQHHWFGIIWTQWCGGSLITTRTVVSAAHCYDGDRASQWTVILGTSTASGTGGNAYNVERIINHEHYNSRTMNNDVSVIWLASSVTFSYTIQPVSIAGTNYNLADGTLLTTIGWGALSPGGIDPGQLQAVDINAINQELCAERYAHLKTLPGFSGWPDITPEMLCAGILDVGGKGGCQGDFGGPLVTTRDHVLVGIFSWGYSCADVKYPGVNARVSALSAWIVANGQ